MTEQESLLTQSEIEKSVEAYEKQRQLEVCKKSLQKESAWAVECGLGLIALSAAIVIIWEQGLWSLFRNVFFFIGGILLVAGVYDFYKARTLTLEELTPDPQALRFEKQVAAKKPVYLVMMTACLIV